MKLTKSISIVMLLFYSSVTFAQGTIEDYQRAYSLRNKFSNKNVFYSDVNPQWIADTNQFWYIRNTPEGKVYVVVNAETRKRKELFNHQQLAKALAGKTNQEIIPTELSLNNLNVNNSQDTLCFNFNNHNWQYLSRKNQLNDLGELPVPPKQKHWMETDDEKDGQPVISPDGSSLAFIKNDNIYVRDIKTGKERQLSKDGTLSNYYSSYIQWSPDGKYVASCKIRPIQKRYVYYVESSPTDQLQPKLHKQEYAKPGDELPFKVPCIYEVSTAKEIIPQTDLFASQYDLNNLQWNSDSRAITFEYNQRGHQVYRVLELSAETGDVSPLIEETSDKYVNYARYFRHDLKNNQHIIWMSERDNWNHLYMYDRATRQPSHQITKGEWYVRQVLDIDEDNQQIWFTANGVQSDEDPYLIRYYRINFDGSQLTCLTPDEGMHTAWLSNDKTYLVDVNSMVNKAPVAVLRSATNGETILPLEVANIVALVTVDVIASSAFFA